MSDDIEKEPGRKRRKVAAAPLAPTIDLTATEVAAETSAKPDEKAGAEEAVAREAGAGEAVGEEAVAGEIVGEEAVLAREADSEPVAAEPVAVEDATAQPAGDSTAPISSATPRGETPQTGTPDARREEMARAPGAPRLDVFEEPQRAQEMSMLPLVVAALIGGVAGGAVVLAVALSGLLPGFRAADDSLPVRLAAVEQDMASSRRLLDETVGRLTAAEQSARSASDVAANAVNLAEEAKVAAASDKSGLAAADAKPIIDRLGKLEAEMSDTRTSLAPVSDRATAAAVTATQVEAAQNLALGRIAALEKSAATPTPDKSAALAVALAQLAEAVENGRPFDKELGLVTALGGNADNLAPLSALAPKGAPSLAALTLAFDRLAPELTAAATPRDQAPPPEAGFLDRLWFNLGTVVSVTREGDAQRSGGAQQVAAVSDALRRGDLAGAVKAFEALPEPARALGTAWLTQARATLAASALARAEAVSALEKLASK
jgi:hypothetical protein